MKRIVVSFLVLVILALIFASGCTDSGGSSSPAGTTVTTTATESSQQSGFSLNPTPTDQVPSGYEVGAKAYKDPISAMINVEFTGGKGLYMTESVSTTVYLSDGSMVTENIEPKMGSDVEIQGTKGEDRVTVTATMQNGQSYKIFDEIIGYRD
ncbi:hypothetical protein [Methanolacinia paynteri]|uniref:hypothetical protein n=1 Tax=Methanolacinia paynteri TaxID=230356 RepID=UPI00064F02D9|nr:hypothetical protein [Methanolacinia paynteri]